MHLSELLPALRATFLGEEGLKIHGFLLEKPHKIPAKPFFTHSRSPRGCIFYGPGRDFGAFVLTGVCFSGILFTRTKRGPGCGSGAFSVDKGGLS